MLLWKTWKKNKKKNKLVGAVLGEADSDITCLRLYPTQLALRSNWVGTSQLVQTATPSRRVIPIITWIFRWIKIRHHLRRQRQFSQSQQPRDPCASCSKIDVMVSSLIRTHRANTTNGWHLKVVSVIPVIQIRPWKDQSTTSANIKWIRKTLSTSISWDSQAIKLFLLTLTEWYQPSEATQAKNTGKGSVQPHATASSSRQDSRNDTHHIILYHPVHASLSLSSSHTFSLSFSVKLWSMHAQEDVEIRPQR